MQQQMQNRLQPIIFIRSKVCVTVTCLTPLDVTTAGQMKSQHFDYYHDTCIKGATKPRETHNVNNINPIQTHTLRKVSV